MNTRNVAATWLVLALAGTCLKASAQKEQWLQYKVDSEGRGYRYLDLTTNPPPNLQLSKLSAQPYFAWWASPMDPAGGRWLCFDRSTKSGPYDRLFYDASGGGKLGEKPAQASRSDEYAAYFNGLRFVFKGEDGPITYHLNLRFMKYEERDARLLASSAGYYEGMVDVGGTKRRVQLTDANANAVFNDMDYDAGANDRVRIEDNDRMLGRLVEVGKDFYEIQVARDGAFIKLKKAENVPMGEVTVSTEVTSFTAIGQNGQFSRKPENGRFTVPAGRYRIQEWTLKRKDDHGASWSLSGYNLDETSAFEVAAGGRPKVEVGEPIRAVMQANQLTNRVEFSLRFLGRYNETVQIQKGDQDPPGPRLTLTSLDGSFQQTNKFEFG